MLASLDQDLDCSSGLQRIVDMVMPFGPLDHARLEGADSRFSDFARSTSTPGCIGLHDLFALVCTDEVPRLAIGVRTRRPVLELSRSGSDNDDASFNSVGWLLLVSGEPLRSAERAGRSGLSM